MKNTISKKYIVDYITENYGELRHDPDAMVKAIRETAKHYDLDKIALFHYIIEGAGGIPMTTSYGFDTRYGREIKYYFESKYYEHE